MESKVPKIDSTMATTAAAKPIVVLVTGANTGIGLELAKEFSKRPNHVVIGTTRDLSNGKELEQAGCKVTSLDVASDESCKTLSKRLSSELGVDKIE